MNTRNYTHALVFAIIILLCTEAFATITGTVTDTVGDPVEGALVTFTDESNPADNYNSTTDSNGNYELNLGIYFPPTDVVVIDVPNDHGHQLQLSWTLSPDDATITHYNIYRSRNPELTEPVDIESFSSLEALIEAEQNLTIHIAQVPSGQNTFTDQGVPLNNTTYYYWLEASSDVGSSEKVAAGIFTGVDSTKDAKQSPGSFTLEQNYPNPFNPITTIPFTLKNAGFVDISIYNILGQKVCTLVISHFTEGVHAVTWDAIDHNGNKVGAGIYLYQLRSSGHVESKKMLLIDGGSFRGVSSTLSKMTFNGSSVAKPSVNNESKTYRVTITGVDIETYEESGLTLVDGGIYDFVVVRKTSETEIHGITFVSIPAGTFQMGSSGYIPAEKPVHTVTLDGFEMSIYEITNAQYVAYLYEALDSGDITVDTSGIEGPGETYLERQYIQYHPEVFEKCQIRYNENEGIFEIEDGKDNNPITNISWYGAKAFALHYGFDLPTEAEWEYACRAETDTKYYTGNNMSSDGKTSTDLDLAGWYSENSEGISHPVGQKEANDWGLYDMHGNIAELCHDWYDWSYYSNSPINNPTGPPSEVIPSHSFRGGSYSDFANRCRSAFRDGGGGKSMYEGFRVVHRAGSSHY